MNGIRILLVSGNDILGRDTVADVTELEERNLTASQHTDGNVTWVQDDLVLWVYGIGPMEDPETGVEAVRSFGMHEEAATSEKDAETKAYAFWRGCWENYPPDQYRFSWAAWSQREQCFVASGDIVSEIVSKVLAEIGPSYVQTIGNLREKEEPAVE